MAQFFGRSQPVRVTNTIATQFPFFGDGAPVTYWPDKGLVRWRDEREGLPEGRKHGFLTWQDAARRVLELSAMVIRSSEEEGRKWAFERQRLQLFISEMEEVIRTAKEQGGPLDGSSVARDYIRRRPVTSVPLRIAACPPPSGRTKIVPSKTDL